MVTCADIHHDCLARMNLSHEFKLLLQCVLVGGITGFFACTPLIFVRWYEGKPLLKPEKPWKLESPALLYVGMAVPGALAALAVTAHMPLFGLVFTIVAAVYAGMLRAYRRGWRG